MWHVCGSAQRASEQEKLLARHGNLLALDEQTSFFLILIGEQLLKYRKFKSWLCMKKSLNNQDREIDKT